MLKLMFLLMAMIMTLSCYWLSADGFIVARSIIDGVFDAHAAVAVAISVVLCLIVAMHD